MENELLQANLTGFKEGFNLGKALILELWGGAGWHRAVAGPPVASVQALNCPAPHFCWREIKT